ncbi:MAG: beta-ketoacyl synthase N-terminal-like domain-containing protein, partial [Myxococcota bacterium]
MRDQPIAVVGISALFPGSQDDPALSGSAFWRNILEGRDLITDVPAEHWLIEDYYDPDPRAPDKTYAKRGAFLPEVDFDPLSWGVPPSVMPATDTCQLLALIVAQQVLADAAKGQFAYTDRERMSCILGVTSAQELLGTMVSRLQHPAWRQGLREAGFSEDEVERAVARISDQFQPWQESTFPGVLGNVVAGRIANRLDLGGTNCVTDAACASTFSALSMGVNELHLGDSDVVICGGADTMNDIFMYMCFSKTPALSKSGDCRPFSAEGDGTMLGEGLGMVALKRLDDAERDGDRVYAVVKGVGQSSDGKGTAVYAPVSKGQAKAIRRAYERAGYGADTVTLVEAHGTGTIAGDAAEFEGLRMVFDESGREDRQWCALGSVKSQIGHAKAAAGAAGLVKAVFALHHKVLPPTIKIDAPNPKLRIDESPFHLATRARPWVQPMRGGKPLPRRAGVSSFGFGGSNFHIALEEYAGPAKPGFLRRTHASELVVLGSEGNAALADAARALADEVEGGDDALFRFVARTRQEAFAAAEVPARRVAVVAKDADDLARKLRAAAERIGAMNGHAEEFTTPDGVAFGMGAATADVAFVFPGQGSQYVDMGAGLAMAYPAAREAWDLAARLGPSLFGDARLEDVVFPRPDFTDGRESEARLRATEWTQPALGVASLALLRVLRGLGVAPRATAGHSFGEIMALHAAGVLNEEDALRVAERRGALMAEAAEQTSGAMTAVATDAETLRALLADWGLDVVLANHNAPNQCVLSGEEGAIAAAEAKLEDASIRFKRLSVGTAFHSTVVSASTAPFADFLAGVDFHPAAVSVYGNTHAALYPSEPGAMRALVAAQIAEPVRFVDEVEAMYAAGIRVFLEVGPGHVMSGLVGKILGDRPHVAVALDRRGKDGATALHLGLARLVAAGVPLRLGALWEGFEAAEDPRAQAKPKLSLKISGANYQKKYPPVGGAAAKAKPNPPKAAPEAEIRYVDRPVERVVEKIVEVPVGHSKDETNTLPQAAPQALAPQVPPPPQAPQLAGAYLALQAQAVHAHVAFSQSMALAHQTFLAVQQQVVQTLPALAAGQPLPAAAVAPAFPAMPAMPALPPAAPQFAAPQFAAPQFAAPQFAAPQ